MPERPSLEMFVSYSHHDGEWRQRLFDDFIQTTFGDCRIWTDAQIRVGERWNDEIQQHLDASSVGVLLVSEAFLGSDFILRQELPRLMARAREAQLRIVWIPIGITREALAQRPELAELQGATGFDDALPASPRDCPPETLARVRQQIRQQLLSAVDPVGAELAQLVDRRYDVECWLAEGNLAAVYKARDRVLQRDVAIKVLKDKGQRQAFMADVHDAIRTSEEPNFVNVYDAATEEVTAYCVVQHVRGKTLRERIAEHPRGLPINTLRRIFTRVGAAMVRAHALGVTYGNLKPSNIILDEDDEPFILPMGRRRDPARQQAAVRELLDRIAQAQASDTPVAEADLEDLAYLAPESFGEQFEAVDTALTDQYMLGLLVHEMATGQRPAAVADPARLQADGRAAFRPLPLLTDSRRLCPQRIAAMVARMTALRPRQRYPDLRTLMIEARQLDDLSLVIARDSYRRCTAADGFDARFFHGFYDDFLRRCPEARQRFARFGPDDWARQHAMLKEAVLLLFAFRQQNDAQAEPNVLSRVAASHRGIPAAFYERFVDALVATVCGDEAAGLQRLRPRVRRPGAARRAGGALAQGAGAGRGLSARRIARCRWLR